MLKSEIAIQVFPKEDVTLLPDHIFLCNADTYI